jgi:hypothetical protein
VQDLVFLEDRGGRAIGLRAAQNETGTHAGDNGGFFPFFSFFGFFFLFSSFLSLTRYFALTALRRVRSSFLSLSFFSFFFSSSFFSFCTWTNLCYSSLI